MTPLSPARLRHAVVAALALGACGQSDSNVCLTPDVVLDTSPVDTGGTTPADTGVGPDATQDTGEPDADKRDVVDATDSAVDTPSDSALPECPWTSWDEGLHGGRVDLVAFDPRVPGTAWAAAGGTIVRSTDAGLTWEIASEDLQPGRLVFPPDDRKNLLAATGAGIYVSYDTARSFEPLALTGLGVRSLFAHPANPLRVFAGTGGAGILRSDDGGKSFTPFNVGVPRMYVEAIAGPADNADVVLATGVLQSDVYGPQPSGVIVRSGDGGRTWATVSSDVVWGSDLAVCPADPSHILAAVRKGVLESRDAGVTWTRIGILGNRDAISLAWAPGGCDTFWVAVYQQGVFRVEDGGLTSIGPMEDGFDFEILRFAGQLSSHPTDPDVLLVATHAGLYRSGDGGFHWTPIEAVKGLSVSDLDASGDRVWLATWGNGLWTRSGDTAWEKVQAVPRDLMATVAPDPSDPERAIVGANADAWVTQTGPGGFVLAPGVRNARESVTLPTGEMLVTSQVDGIKRSSQPEVAWTPSNDGLAPFATPAGTFIDAPTIVSDPNVVGRVYVGLNGQGVAVSEDLGRSWGQPPNALSAERVQRLVVDAGGGQTKLYALVDGKGVWVSLDGALTWTSENRGLDNLRASDIAIDPVTGRLYLAEGGGPIHESADGLVWKGLDRWCLPFEGWGGLAVMEIEGERWLVAATIGNRVIRHRL